MDIDHWTLQALDFLLMGIHLSIIVINVFGWIFPSTRRLQRIVLGLTTVSWFGFGVWFGWGYCFLTDWHWEIKRSLGEGALPASYIQYVLRNRLGLSIPDLWVDVMTGLVFVLVLIITISQLLREHRRSS